MIALLNDEYDHVELDIDNEYTVVVSVIALQTRVTHLQSQATTSKLEHNWK